MINTRRAPSLSTATVSAADHNRRLRAEIGALRFDPLGYVTYAFPWGRAGTALAEEDGPKYVDVRNNRLVFVRESPGARDEEQGAAEAQGDQASSTRKG